MIISLLALASSLLLNSQASNLPLPHLELDLTGAEYSALLKNSPSLKISAADPLNDILKLGARNLAWLGSINAHRPADQQLDLWTPENTLAFPIYEPGHANRTLITTEMNQLKAALPPQYKQVLFSNSPVPSDFAGIAESTFLDHSRKMDRIYQRASRWLLQEPSLFAYQQRAWMDLRGLYALNTVANLDTVLLDFKNQSVEKKDFLSANLILVCMNSRNSKSGCTRELKESLESDGHPLNFKKRFWDQSVAHWNSFFNLGARRSDVRWNANEANRIQMPFRIPGSTEIQNWLESNIEDEWKVLPVRLDMVFSSSSRARIEFEPGATPHVNGLGGDVITMDSNRPLQHYSTRWTIRHEFGHVIGFPDCYLEFYDSEKEVMINYQLDITNLMCSRRGHLQPLHINELKKNYFQGRS